MQTRIIEAMQPGGKGNWGKFMVMRPDSNEWLHRSRVSDSGVPLLFERGWAPHHVIVLDIETCEAAVFAPHGSAHHDLLKRRIWVCPLFKPFLEWLYTQDLDDISTLPTLVEIDAEFEAAGYRRPGSEDPPKYVSDEPLEDVLANLRDYANAGEAASRAAAGRAVIEIEALLAAQSGLGELHAALELLGLFEIFDSVPNDHGYVGSGLERQTTNFLLRHSRPSLNDPDRDLDQSTRETLRRAVEPALALEPDPNDTPVGLDPGGDGY